jgi:3-hydroxymyristoyl/3-hydroxydecanoyl-(acyl carrier protein) dehydratase
MRYFLIDKVTALIPGESAAGVKCVSLSDEILHDHFPDYPAMPGALIVESAAQLAGFLLEMTVNKHGEPLRRALLVQIQNAKFHELCVPGDRLDVTVKIDSLLAGAAQVSAEATVDGKRVARAILTFALKSIDSERVHEQRRYVYRLWTRHFDPPLTIH